MPHHAKEMKMGPSGNSVCDLCGETMPEGEEMFRFHGFSCECPTENRQEHRAVKAPPSAKPFSTYPEERAKLLSLAEKVAQSAGEDAASADKLADLVRAILTDEEFSLNLSNEAQP